MITKRHSLRIATVLFLGMVLASAAFASLETAWDSLVKNNPDAAYSDFQAALDAGGGEEALRGLLTAAWTRGDSPDMAKILSRLVTEYPDSPYTPAYLAFWGGSEFHGWKTRDRVQTLETALQKSVSPSHRQQLAFELMETLDMLLDDRVESSARNAGILLDDWAVAGPFGQYGAADFFRPFGPEIEFSAAYAGWKGETAFKPVDPIDKTGLVELSSLICPDTGVAYAVNVVESDTQSDAWLTVASPAAIQVWWNGTPVIEKAHYFLQSAQYRTVAVPVKAGKNLLVIKSQKTNQSWWLRAALQSKENGELNVKSVPFQWNDFASTYLVPVNVALPRSQESTMVESPYPFALPDPSEPGERIAKNLLTATWHLDRGEYDKSRQIILETEQWAPEFALLYALFGDYSLRFAADRSGSKSRFHQEAETSLRRALELDPLCQSALINLVTYFLDRDQTDQALDTLNRHLEKNPSLRERDRSNLIDYAYSILYSKKNFEADAAAAAQKSIDGWISSYEAYRILFDYYARNQNIQQASDLLQQALTDFPAFNPFLERADRLPDSGQVANRVFSLLRQAMLIHPNRLDYPFLLGNLLEHAGKMDEARALYGDLLSRYPEHPRILERQAGLDYLASKKDAAQTGYQKAYAIAPLRQKPFRALRDAGGKNDFPYQKYDVQLSDVDITLADRWNTSRASVIYYLDIMVLDIHEDGSYDQYIHQALKVMNQQGMDKWAEIVIPKGGEVEIIKARTIAPDGTEWDVSNVQNLNDQQSLSMYGVQPGVTLEYAYIEHTGGSEPGVNFVGGGYFFGSDDDPMLLSKLTVVKPENMPLHLAKNPSDFEAKTTRENGKIVYEWEKRMCEGLKPERFAPSLSQRVPSLQWSTCPDWLPFAERERLTLWGYEESSPLIDNLAKRFLSETSSKRDYIQKVYDYVRSGIEETSGGFTTADTVLLSAGGKYQKLRLVRQLLRKGGVDARIALALDREQSSGYRPIPALNYPGSVILFVPRQEEIPERIFLDFSSRFAPLGSLDPTLRKMAAFIVDATSPYFEPMDPPLWEHGLIDRRIELKVNEDRSANIEGQYSFDNQYDRQIREALTNPEVKKRLADAQLAGDWRGIQVKESDILDLDDISVPPRMVFSGVIPDIAKSSDDRILKINSIQVQTNAASLIGEPTRVFRMEFPASPVWDPVELRMDLSCYIDRGAVILLPANVFLLTEFGYYSLFYEWDGKTVIVRRSFLIPEQKIEPEAYGRFVDFCRTIDQSEDRDLLIKLPVKS